VADVDLGQNMVPMTTADSLAARRDKALGAGARLFYREPLHIVRGEGAYLYDAAGKRYVDMYNNVPCVGHGNPAVVDAMTRQQATLNVHSRYLHEGIVSFAERLTALHGDTIESVVFGCSGTEAIEVALRMARTATGRRGIIGTNATYHGNSDAVSQLSRASSNPEAFPEIRTIPFPERLRPIETGLDDEALAGAYLERLSDAIKSLDQSGIGTAAMVLCSIMANEGLPDIPVGFISRAAEMVRAAGGLVIADEVQAGYCRTGCWWGYEVSDFEPDIVVTGKPMGNGLPLSATAASRDVVEQFRAATGYFNTFAASPLQAAVGSAVIDEIERHDLRDNVARVGRSLKAALADRLPTREWLGDVRGHGLFIGVEMVSDSAGLEPDADRAIDVVNRLKDRGFLTSNAGAHRNLLKIRPPLVFSQDDADEFVNAFDETLAEIDG
jgi:4-aminobutyrate aminotransferase-like enzyme